MLVKEREFTTPTRKTLKTSWNIVKILKEHIFTTISRLTSQIESSGKVVSDTLATRSAFSSSRYVHLYLGNVAAELKAESSERLKLGSSDAWLRPDDPTTGPVTGFQMGCCTVNGGNHVDVGNISNVTTVQFRFHFCIRSICRHFSPVNVEGIMFWAREEVLNVCQEIWMAKDCAVVL